MDNDLLDSGDGDFKKSKHVSHVVHFNAIEPQTNNRWRNESYSNDDNSHHETSSSINDDVSQKGGYGIFSKRDIEDHTLHQANKDLVQYMAEEK